MAAVERLKPFFRNASNGLLLIALILAWEVYARTTVSSGVSRFISFPAPSAGLVDALALLKSGVLEGDIYQSLKRVYVGFAFAAIFALPLGIWMGLNRTANEQIEPIINLLRPIPPVAWVPISILWFGVTDYQQYAIIAAGTFFPLLLNTVSGVRAVDPSIKRAALSLGADRLNLFRVTIRAAMPQILLGVRVSLGLGWFIIVASEMVSASSGMGFLITEARTSMRTEHLYVGMVTIGLIGILQDQALGWLESKVVPWQ